MKLKVFVLGLFLLFSFPLLAQYKKFEMNPPAAKKYLKSQLNRMDQVRKYKILGYIGEAEQAVLSVRDIKSLTKTEQEKIKKTVDEENADRKAIFSAIAKYNKLNKHEYGFLLKSAYETYRNTDPKGTYYYEGRQWQKRY